MIAWVGYWPVWISDQELEELKLRRACLKDLVDDTLISQGLLAGSMVLFEFLVLLLVFWVSPPN